VNAVRSEALAAAVASGDPIVFVGRRNPSGGGAFVGIDDRRAGADVADHLWAIGIRDYGAIYPMQLSSATRGRIEGYVGRLVEHGVPFRAIRQAQAPGLSHLEIGYAAAQRLLGDGAWPKALFCPSDLMAYGAYRLATERGIGVPGDCRITGVDDNGLNAWIAPWLTSVHVPYHAFGDEVVKQLDTLWAGEDPKDRILPHGLVVR
jgi:LacI family transcriptional regulator